MDYINYFLGNTKIKCTNCNNSIYIKKKNYNNNISYFCSSSCAYTYEQLEKKYGKYSVK